MHSIYLWVNGNWEAVHIVKPTPKEAIAVAIERSNHYGIDHMYGIVENGGKPHTLVYGGQFYPVANTERVTEAPYVQQFCQCTITGRTEGSTLCSKCGKNLF